MKKDFHKVKQDLLFTQGRDFHIHMTLKMWDDEYTRSLKDSEKIVQVFQRQMDGHFKKGEEERLNDIATKWLIFI